MDLKQFRYFIAVAEELHFGRAAKKLHRSQPPLSQQIKALEEEVGVRLFERNRRGVSLTEAGGAFLVHTREILTMVQTATDAARRAGNGELGVLRIGYSGSALYSETLLSCIAHYREKFASVDVELRQGPTHMHVEDIHAGRSHLGIVRGPLPTSADGLFKQIFSRERLMVALPVQHPLNEREKIWLKDLRGERFVALPKEMGAALNELLTELYREAGVVPDIAIEATEMSSILGLVGAGAGVSIVPATVTAMSPPHVIFRELEDPSAHAELYAITPAKQTPATINFLYLLKSKAKACREIAPTGAAPPHKQASRKEKNAELA